jgi:hypothetical protein
MVSAALRATLARLVTVCTSAIVALRGPRTYCCPATDPGVAERVCSLGLGPAPKSRGRVAVRRSTWAAALGAAIGQFGNSFTQSQMQIEAVFRGPPWTAQR